MKTVEKSTCGSNPSFEFDQNLAKEEIDDSLRNGMERLSGRAPNQQPAEDHFHNTKYLLKQFRRVRYAVRVSESDLNLRMEIEHGTELSTLEVNAELAGMDLSNTRLERYTRSIVRSRNMLRVIQSALDTVRMDPDDGERMYQILYLTYFTPVKPKNREAIMDELEKLGFPMSAVTYHAHLSSAIQAMDRILWGYTTRDCMEIIRQFLPDSESQNGNRT